MTVPPRHPVWDWEEIDRLKRDIERGGRWKSDAGADILDDFEMFNIALMRTIPGDFTPSCRSYFMSMIKRDLRDCGLLVAYREACDAIADAFYQATTTREERDNG